MSSKNERERMAFHRRQMDALPTLISGLDPDPPILLCPRTVQFDGLVCQALRAAGWPSSGKSAEQRKADPPAPIKGAVLARKLAKGNGLTGNEVKLLAMRVAWLQRNWFRWSARDGYHVLRDSKTPEQAVPAGSRSADLKAPAKTTDRDMRGPQSEAQPEPDRDLFAASQGRIASDTDEAEATKGDGAHSLNAAARSVEHDHHEGLIGSSTGSSDRSSEAAKSGGSMDRFDAALASLERLSDNEDLPSFDDYVNAIGEQGSDEADDHLISLRTKSIKTVDGDKVQSFLFAIRDKEPLGEIERRARVLAAERTQLSRALSRGDSTSEDVRVAFGKLGLDADV